MLCMEEDVCFMDGLHRSRKRAGVFADGLKHAIGSK